MLFVVCFSVCIIFVGTIFNTCMYMCVGGIDFALVSTIFVNWILELFGQCGIFCLFIILFHVYISISTFAPLKGPSWS